MTPSPTRDDQAARPGPPDPKPFRVRSRKLPTTAAGIAVLAVSSVLYAPELVVYGWFWAALASLLAVLGLVHLLTRTQVDVGLDGVLIRRGWSTHFIDHDDIVRVEQVKVPSQISRPAKIKKGQIRHYRVILSLRSGADVELRDAVTLGSDAPEETLAQAIKEARRRRRRLRSQAHELLLPGGRDARAWLLALRRLGQQDYRRRFIAPETLAAVIDDSRAPAAARAGAALALEASQGDGKQRLRSAVEAIADPAGRAQLLRLCDGDDEAELEAALEELAAAQRGRHSSSNG